MEIVIHVLALVVGILAGITAIDMAQRIKGQKKIAKTEEELKDLIAKLSELHNKHAKTLADLSEKVQSHDFVLKSVQSKEQPSFGFKRTT